MTQMRNAHWVMALAALLTAGCAAAGENRTPTPLPPLEVVEPAEYVVERGTVQRTVTFTGRVEPARSQPVFFEEEGVVSGVLLQQGDLVSAGDLIAYLDMADLQHERATAELRLQAAELQTNQTDLVAAELALSQAVTEDDRRLAEAQLADAQHREEARAIEIQLLREEVNRLDGEITRRQVEAPFDGVLLAVTVRPGDSVTAFERVAIVADPSQLEVAAEAPPAMLSVLGVGQAVTVTLPSSGLSFNSVIRQLPAGFGASGDSLVHITLPEASHATSGELATVFVILEEKHQVLTLPLAAIRTFQGRTFVVVSEPDGARRYDVLLGLQGDTRVEIVDGLVEGQVVIGE